MSINLINGAIFGVINGVINGVIKWGFILQKELPGKNLLHLFRMYVPIEESRFLCAHQKNVPLLLETPCQNRYVP